MTMLHGTRLWRPSAVSLVLVLLAAVLAPLILTPAPAQADVCDLPGISQACDGADAAAGAAGDVIDGVVDAGKAAIKGVKVAATWAGDNAGAVMKAALAVGLPLATWVACSKVAKVVAAASAATAAGAGTAGVGAAPAAIAGAAGAQAVCMVLKKGGKVLLKVGKKGLKSGGKLANIAKLAAGAVGLAAIVYGVDHAAAWVLENLLDLDAASAPNLDAGWLTNLREGLNGMAGVLLLLATILGMTLAGVMGRASDVGRIFTSMVSVALIIGVVGSLLLAGLQVSDEMTARTLNSSWGQQSLGNWKDLGDSYAEASPKTGDDAASPGESRTQPGEDETAADAGASAMPATGTPQADDKGPWPIRLLIAFCTALFGALVWLEMQIRDGLLYLLLAFGGLLLAGYPFPATRGIAQKFGMTLLGVVIAKPVIVITLLIGGAMMQSAAAGATEDGAVIPMLQGAGLMALAALMGTAILAWFNLHGASAMSGLGARMATGAVGGGFGGSRPNGGSGGGGSSDGGPGGGGGGGGGAPSGSDPTRDLARGVGDRVNAGGGGVGQAGAIGAAALAGGAMSSRLQAAQARESGAPGGGSGGVDGSASGGGAAARGDRAASVSSEAPTQSMPVASSGQDPAPVGASGGADGAPPEAGAAGGSTSHGEQAGSQGGGLRSPAATAAAGLATAAAAGASATGRSGPQAATAAAAGMAATPELSAAASTSPRGPGGRGNGVVGAPQGPETAGAGPGPGAAPASASVPSGTSVPGASGLASAPASPRESNADAYAAFGAPAPGDAAAAFSDHAAEVRAALDARPEVRA